MVWIIDKHHAGRLAHINCSDQYVAMALKTKTPQEAWDKCASGADLIYQLAYETHRGGVGLKSVVAVVTHCVRTALDSGAVAFFPEAELILQDVEAWLIGRRVDFKRTMRNLARDSTPHGDSDTIYRALFDLVPLAGRLEGWHVDDERVAEVAREALKEVATTMAWDMVEKRVVERGVPYDSPEYGPEHDDENNAWFEDELKISSATVAAWVRSQVPNPPKPPKRKRGRLEG